METPLQTNKRRTGGYNPLSKDTDGDGLNDNYEDATNFGFRDSSETSVVLSDTDDDGLTDSFEIEGWIISVYYETSGEIIETFKVFSNPMMVDSDNDGLRDFEEWIYNSNPSKMDTDSDHLDDLEEKENGTKLNGYDGIPPEIKINGYSYEVETNRLNIIKKVFIEFNISISDPFGLDTFGMGLLNIDKEYYLNGESNFSSLISFSYNGLDIINSILNNKINININVIDMNSNSIKKHERIDIEDDINNILDILNNPRILNNIFDNIFVNIIEFSIINMQNILKSSEVLLSILSNNNQFFNCFLSMLESIISMVDNTRLLISTVKALLRIVSYEDYFNMFILSESYSFNNFGSTSDYINSSFNQMDINVLSNISLLHSQDRNMRC